MSLYDTRLWKALRKRCLEIDPLCVKCLESGIVAEATVVDHIIPHKDDRTLFFDSKNLQSLCKPCHDKGKQFEEGAGFDKRVGADGFPIDPRHPFNKTRA